MTYGLIGEHLPHSFSKEIHALCADYTYELHELTPDAVEGFMQAAEFTAINVTIPYKRTVMPYLHHIHPHAESIGAVNTVVNKGGELYGYNTDFYGMSSLIRRVGIDPKGKKALVLGTGGAAHTAVAVLKSMGAREVLVVERWETQEFISYETAYRDHADAEVIVNATPCGMFPYPDGNESIKGTPIDVAAFPGLCGVVDAVYNPLRTNLVQDAIDRGIPAEGGLYMLVAQAVMASRIFLGHVDEAFGDEASMDAASARIYQKILSDKENIVLTGMPGSGKSTVGRALAELLDRPFVDTDALIVEKTGKQISDIFAEVGEKGFRDIETQVVKEASGNLTGHIIATGGGAILRDENVRALRRTGRLYFLNRSLEALIPTEDRPLASTVEAIRKRFEERYHRYLATADREVVIDEVVEHTVKTIREDFFA